MEYVDTTPGLDVWIIRGTHKGKKGTITAKGWGVVTVNVGGEHTAFSPESLTTKDPEASKVPLPPSFIPCEFKLGDIVEVSNHGNGSYNGIRGEVVRLPTSVSYRNGGDKRYRIKVTGQGTSSYSIGNDLYFEGSSLKKYVAGERIEGYEINHEDVKVGDEIRVELKSSKGGYSQISVKQGKVTAISRRLQSTGNPCTDYTFRTSDGAGWTGSLNYGAKEEKIFLLKAAEDPFIAIVDGLAAGTVVVLEEDSGKVLTFVKSVDYVNQTQWHKVSSQSKYSSTFVSDSDIIEVLNNGAEIVHKVRKPVPVPF